MYIYNYFIYNKIYLILIQDKFIRTKFKIQLIHQKFNYAH